MNKNESNIESHSMDQKLPYYLKHVTGSDQYPIEEAKSLYPGRVSMANEIIKKFSDASFSFADAEGTLSITSKLLEVLKKDSIIKV